MLALQFFTVMAALAAVGVALRRVRRAEDERAAFAARLVELETRAARREDAETETSAAVGALTGQLCHLVVSPLTVILGQCELARAAGDAGPRLETIERQARRIATVVERHRGLARDRVGAPGPIEPRACLRACLDAARLEAAARGVGFHVLLEDTPLLRANAALLTHAVRQLLRAGIEAASQGKGDVTFAVGRLPGDTTHLAFAVADDGPGLDDSRVAAIFETGKDAAEWPGASYAYPIVHALARSMGAELVVDSAPGQGTRATLKVPLSAAVPAQSAPAATPVTA